jgi:hypothetical protein
MTPHLHLVHVAGCDRCELSRGAVLDTGPWCSICGIHRAASAGGRCPGCIEDGRNEHRAATA